MRMTDPLIIEPRQEAQTMRRVLERIPEGKLSRRPHKKSMSLWQLGLQVAQNPEAVAQTAKASLAAPPLISRWSRILSGECWRRSTPAWPSRRPPSAVGTTPG